MPRIRCLRKWLRVALFASVTIAALSVLIASAALAYYVTRSFDPAPLFRVEASGEMLARDGTLLYPFLNASDQWCFPRALNEMSPKLVQATLAAEDKRFYSHPGVDVFALTRAVFQDLWAMRVKSGASTVTMQVVKLAGRDSDSPLGKILQLAEALRLDWHAEKDTILDAYLNRAPYGLNLIGAEAAARRYFGKPAAELTLTEAALIAGLPKSPSAFMPMEHPEAAKARRDRVLGRMLDAGFIDAETCRAAKASPLGAAWNEFPGLAPHLAQYVRERAKGGNRIRTTLDAAVQADIEARAAKYLKQYDNEVTNAAVIVVDTASCEALARVGSANFFDAINGGQMDLCSSPRSPGSALKPFTYALAIEKNCLYPSEELLDDTLDYGAYNPLNFDGEYNGLIPAGEALHYSLNVPAVMVLDRIGPVALRDFLVHAGITTLSKPADFYGLGLTLGNCPVRLDEVTAAYVMLANEGEYRRIRYSLDAPQSAPERLLERGTALSVYEMLRAPFPDENREGLVSGGGGELPVCWKTGTSTGYHDAWAFAFNKQYTVGVWLGNNNGAQSRRLIGIKAALPLAARIFRALPPKSASAWPNNAGGDLRPVEVCAISGLPAGPSCPATRTEWLSRNQYLHRLCNVHAPALGGGTAERWPASAYQWDLAKINRPVTVNSAPLASRESKNEVAVALSIAEPPNRAEYVLTGEANGDRIRLATSLDGRQPIHWYLDDRYLGVSTAEKPYYLQLTLGQHKLACMVESGQTAAAEFAVIRPDGDSVFEGK